VVGIGTEIEWFVAGETSQPSKKFSQEFVNNFISYRPRAAGSGVVRIEPLRFLAGCRKRRLNQALSVLSLSMFLL